VAPFGRLQPVQETTNARPEDRHFSQDLFHEQTVAQLVGIAATEIRGGDDRDQVELGHDVDAVSSEAAHEVRVVALELTKPPEIAVTCPLVDLNVRVRRGGDPSFGNHVAATSEVKAA